jgi:hypothetical protein
MISLTFRKVECWHWSGAADDRPTQRMGRSARRALPEITQSAESHTGAWPRGCEDGDQKISARSDQRIGLTVPGFRRRRATYHRGEDRIGGPRHS